MPYKTMVKNGALVPVLQKKHSNRPKRKTWPVTTFCQLFHFRTASRDLSFHMYTAGRYLITYQRHDLLSSLFINNSASSAKGGPTVINHVSCYVRFGLLAIQINLMANITGGIDNENSLHINPLHFTINSSLHHPSKSHH